MQETKITKRLDLHFGDSAYFLCCQKVLADSNNFLLSGFGASKSSQILTLGMFNMIK